MRSIQELADVVRQTAYDIHVYHKHGHLEKIYENALVHRLQKCGLYVAQQFPLQVCDEDGSILGDYFADLVVDEQLLVELKAVKQLAREHEAQVLAYLKSCRIKHGILINFGAYTFEIRKFISPFQCPAHDESKLSALTEQIP